MRREVKILLFTVAAGAAWASRSAVRESLDGMELFRVTDVRVGGLRYLDRNEVLERLELTPETSIWGDVDAWRAALETHPLVKSVRVSRRIPGRLDIAVVERTPVALVPTPTVEPVDAEGARLPLDPARNRLDLPLVSVSGASAAGSRLLPERVRTLVREVARLGDADTTFLRMASEIGWHDSTSLVVRWTQPAVDFFLPMGTSAARLREGLLVLDDALAKRPDRPPAAIDLRYADQVVVRGTR